jgi:hypothetical protein
MISGWICWAIKTASIQVMGLSSADDTDGKKANIKIHNSVNKTFLDICMFTLYHSNEIF